MKLIDLDFDEAAAIKHECGRQKYRAQGEGTFVGEPLPELFEELLDAVNYAQEAEKQGIALPGVVRDLRDIADRVRRAWRDREGVQFATSGRDQS